MRKQLQSSVLVVMFFFTFSAASEAARLENRFTGRVTVVSGTAQEAIAALGVTQGAAASVVFGVETTTQGVPAEGFMHYTGAITDWTIDIGSFRAAYDPSRGLNAINIADNYGQPPVDTYGAAVFVTSTNDILGIGGNANMILSEIGSGAIASSDVGQDLSRFDSGSIAVGGSAAILSIALDLQGGGGGGGPSRPPTCLPAQIQSGGALCKAALLCRAKSAAGPALDACIGKAEASFVAKYNAAAVKAARKGEQCPSARDGAGAARDILEAIQPLAALVLAGADAGSKEDRAYRAALLKAAAAAADKRLKALAADAKKPDAGRLGSALEQVESKLAQGVAKASAKAEAQGVLAQVDAAELVTAVNNVAETALGIANGSLPGPEE
jgi:hypothetical protein